MESVTPSRAFATSIFFIARALSSNDLEKSERQRLREAINDDIRKYSNFLPHRVSKAAARLAGELTPSIDLALHNWHSQGRFDKKRTLFVTEHFNPVSRIVDLCIDAGSIEAIEKILAHDLRIVWVTREEDQRLNKNGHRSDRPDADEAYRLAGIEISEL